jgi:hypothetical protein
VIDGALLVDVGLLLIGSVCCCCSGCVMVALLVSVTVTVTVALIFALLLVLSFWFLLFCDSTCLHPIKYNSIYIYIIIINELILYENTTPKT